MGKVVFEASMALDGFMIPSNRRPKEPMGDGGQRLHEWASVTARFSRRGSPKRGRFSGFVGWRAPKRAVGRALRIVVVPGYRVMQEHGTRNERSRLQELQLHVGGLEQSRAAADDHREHEQPVLIDQPGPTDRGTEGSPDRKQLNTVAMAKPFCPGSRNMLLTSARVEGSTVAPAIPRTVRVAISISGLVEKAANTDAMPNAAAPIKSSLRRPILSPRVPIVTRKPAIMKP
jgi:hypothetical protein